MNQQPLYIPEDERGEALIRALNAVALRREREAQEQTEAA